MSHITFRPVRAAVAAACLAAGLVVSGPAPAQSSRLPQRNLLVEVRQGDQGSLGVQGGGISSSTVVIRSDGRISGGATGGYSVRTTTRSSNLGQQVRVINGGRASIRLGQSAPLQLWNAYVTPQGVEAAPTTVFLEAGQGFSVQPSWPGGNAPALVEISTENGRVRDPGLMIGGDPANGAAVESANVLTTLRVPLGEWVTIASSGVDTTRRDRGTLSTRDVDSTGQMLVQMRITAP